MNPHPFRVLIVEDNPNWHEPMKRALERNFEDAVHCEIAPDLAEARKQLASWRYQLISHDLHIPVVFGDSLDTSVGTNLMEQAGALTSMQLVLSAYMAGPGGLNAVRVSGRLEAPLFTKAPGESIDPSSAPALDAQGWADVVGHALGLCDEACLPDSVRHSSIAPITLQYRPEYWRRAANHLPDALARAAQVIHGEWQQKQENTLRALYRFSEWSLRLAWAQTAVLMRALGMPVRSHLRDDTVKPMEDELLVWLAHGKQALLEVPAWRAHLGLTGRGSADLAEALKTVRLQRNQSAHSLRDLTAADAIWTDLDPSILVLMDIAAFWSQYPLFGRAVQRMAGWEASAIQGTARAGRPLSLPADTFGRVRPDDRRVFQRVPFVQGGAVTWRTLDWYPWLQFLPDKDYAAYRAWLLSHRLPNGRWLQVCLSHSESREVALRDQDFA